MKPDKAQSCWNASFQEYHKGSWRAGEDDIPVLFLPGNGGNFKQVRSLASDSARQAFRRSKGSSASHQQPGLAWLSVDFREERSALDGAILVRSLFIDRSPIGFLKGRRFLAAERLSW